MALNFLNQSRSYDATLHAVRFWGHDGAMEVSFYVNEDALRRIQPGLRLEEVEILGAFDANRGVIHTVAARTYRRGRKSSYGCLPLISEDKNNGRLSIVAGEFVGHRSGLSTSILQGRELFTGIVVYTDTAVVGLEEAMPSSFVQGGPANSTAS